MTTPTTPTGMADCILTDWPLDAKGYGRRMVGGRDWIAHRYAWSQMHGLIPAGLAVCHSCDNPACINVAHLWLGTLSQNTLDRHRKGRDAVGDRNGSRTRPDRRPRGAAMRHPRMGEANGRAKVTAEDVRVIRDRAAAGVSSEVLAVDYGLSPTTVRRIILRRYWPHV